MGKSVTFTYGIRRIATVEAGTAAAEGGTQEAVPEVLENRQLA
ncbi:MAG: hypothetical protein ACR2N7_09805 [Acidimicrobiia bacterium]